MGKYISCNQLANEKIPVTTHLQLGKNILVATLIATKICQL
jgi:hypothetical protein